MILCTVNDVKELTQQSVGYAGNDAIITRAVEMASAAVLNYTKREFTRKVRTEYFMTPETGDGFSVTIKEGPIDQGSPLMVTYDRTGYHSGDFPALLSPGIDFSVDYETGRFDFTGMYLYARKGLRIVYTGGYVVDGGNPQLLQVPASVKHATAVQAGFLFRRLMTQETGVSSGMKENSALTSYNKEAQNGLIPEAIMLLGQVKRVMVGRS